MGWEQFWQYLGVFASLVGAGFGLPIPEEVPIVTGGVLVASEDAGCLWWIMLPICMVGVVLSDVVLYLIGRKYGEKLLDNVWIKRNLLTPEKRKRIEDNYHEYGIRILLFARMLPGIRTPIFMMAGIMKLPFRRFLLADGLYAIPGVNLIFWLSYWFTDSFIASLNRINHHRNMVVAVILAALAGYFLYAFLRRKVSTGEPDIPVIGKTVGQFAHDKHLQSATEVPAIPANTLVTGNNASSGGTVESRTDKLEAQIQPTSWSPVSGH